MARQTIVKTYKGSQASATSAFSADASKMAARGYFPTSQAWAQGSWGCGSFLVALLLCVVFIGIIVFIYMLLVKPAGTLTVTYELQATSRGVDLASSGKLKTCPQCAEDVQGAARVCRYCGHKFI